MKTKGLKQILGKTITGVVVKEKNRKEPFGPLFQIHLIFLDGTIFEMYSSYKVGINFAGYVDDGGFEDVRDHGSGTMNIVYEAQIDEKGQIVEK